MPSSGGVIILTEVKTWDLNPIPKVDAQQQAVFVEAHSLMYRRVLFTSTFRLRDEVVRHHART